MALDNFGSSEDFAVSEDTDNDFDGIDSAELWMDARTGGKSSNVSNDDSVPQLDKTVTELFGNVVLTDENEEVEAGAKATSRSDGRTSDARSESTRPVTTRPATPGADDRGQGRPSDDSKGSTGKGKDAGKDAGEGKPGDNPSDRSRGEQKTEARRIDVALGTNDLSAELGRNARLVRGQESDVLTLPNGYRISVRKDNINKEGMVMGTVTDPNGRVTDIRIGKNNQPVFNVNDGADRTRIKVSPNGHIEAVQTKGKTFRLVPADF